MKIQELVNNEHRLIEDFAQRQRRDKLIAKLAEVRRLKEVELRKLAEVGYRKQATCDRQLYRPEMNQLYVKDLDKQIEMNKRIKKAIKSMQDLMPSSSSLPIGFNTEIKSEKLTSEMKEIKLRLSIKEERKAKVLEEKLSETKEMKEIVELYLKEKEEAMRKAYEKQANLRNRLEEQIAKRQQEFRRKKAQEACISSKLIENAMEAHSNRLSIAQQIRTQWKRRYNEYLQYVRQMRTEQERDETIKESAMEKMAEHVTETNERCHKQRREASQALEKEVRETQIKQMKERESQIKKDNFIKGISFLDKIFAENDKEVNIIKQNEKKIAQELKEHIRTRPVTAFSTDWSYQGRDFTRQHQQPPEGTQYEYLNPLRKFELNKQAS